MGFAKTWADAFRSNGDGLTLSHYIEGAPGYRSLESASQMGTVASRTLKGALTSTSWIREAYAEAASMVRRSLPATVFAATIYVVTFATVLLGAVIYALGVADRLPGGTNVGLERELMTWITCMSLAGILASSLTGDIAARKIREELDALDVLGVDKFRLLVLPRVMALTYVTVVAPCVILVVTNLANLLASISIHHQPLDEQWQQLVLSVTASDLIAACIKHLIIGFFMGVVACQKGLFAKGGAEGVGRAVNETVVICFFGVWLINSLFNMAYLSVFADASAVRG